MASALRRTGAGNETSAVTASGTSVSVPKPPNLADGELLLAYGGNRNQTAASTPPAGWATVSPTGGSVLNSGCSVFFWKYVPSAASEPSTYTWSANATGRMGINMMRITGAHPTNPIDVVGAETNGAGGTAAMALAGVTTTGNDRLILGGVVAQVSAGAASVFGFTTPDMTLGTKVVTGPTTAATTSFTVGAVSQAAVGASGSKTFTPNGTLASDFGYLIAIRPVVTAQVEALGLQTLVTGTPMAQVEAFAAQALVQGTPKAQVEAFAIQVLGGEPISYGFWGIQLS